MEPSRINNNPKVASLPMSHDTTSIHLDTLKDNSEGESSTSPVNQEVSDAAKLDVGCTNLSFVQDDGDRDRRSIEGPKTDNNPDEITARRSLSRAPSNSSGKYCNGFNIPLFQLSSSNLICFIF